MLAHLPAAQVRALFPSAASFVDRTGAGPQSLPELRAELFCSDAFHLVCPVGHPLATVASVRPRDVAAWPFVHLSRTSSVRQYLDAALHPLKMRTLMEVDQLATVMGMVRAGLGISIVPSLTLFHFQQPEVLTRPLAWPGLTRQIYLVRWRDRGLSLAAQSLHDWMLQRRPQLETAAAPKRRAPRAPASRTAQGRGRVKS